MASHQDHDLLARLWDKGNSPINCNTLEILIKDYPLEDVKLELVNGFKNGFRLQYNGPRISVMSRNLLSAEYNKYDTLNKLLKEVKLGRMLGPFTKKPISNLRVSPIGLTPKDDGTWRLITNLSHPLGNSVNDFIDPELCRVQYSSFDKVITMIQT